MSELLEIASAFRLSGQPIRVTPCGNGHINDTFRVASEEPGPAQDTILQRVNHAVFRDVPALMENIGQVTRHQRMKFEQAGAADVHRRALTLVATYAGRDFHRDDEGNYWRAFRYISDSQTIEGAPSTEQVYEAAKAFGEFQCQLADLSLRLHETIPQFHDTRARFKAFIQAVEADPLNRAAELTPEITFVLEHEAITDTVVDLLASGELPERVTHNDTKLNNVLLDASTGKGLCVIDLDTVMPGSVLYDFGDMVRATTCAAPEDERDLSRIRMDMDGFEALVRGYLETASAFLVEAERELLAFSGRLISLELGMRFLTDYLQGDTYFKTHRAGQNLDRCRRQFVMARLMDEQFDEMYNIIRRV